MMRTFFAPAVLAAVPWITEGTILEEFVDFEILAAGLSSSRSRRSRLGRTSGSSRWWEPRPRWPPGSPPAAGDHVWSFWKYGVCLIVWRWNRTMVAVWQIRSLDLARLLCHDGHLVRIVAPCESSDHRADHRLHGAHLVSRTIVILWLFSMKLQRVWVKCNSSHNWPCRSCRCRRWCRQPRRGRAWDRGRRCSAGRRGPRRSGRFPRFW